MINEDGTEEYNSENSVEWFNAVLAPDALVYTRAWNSSVQRWLKYYIYLRVLDKRPEMRGKGAAKAMSITMAIAMIWHGISPGLWFFYIYLFMINLTFDNFSKLKVPAML